MIFRRIFHPVGQGAFFTEQFFDEATNELVYNVVYDCGSFTTDIKVQMESYIKSVFHDKKRIDALFISHFDNDHVNYIKTLKRFKCLEGTKIFIPELWEEKWIKLCSYWDNYTYVLTLDDDSPHGCKVIKVVPDDNKNDNVKELPIENIFTKVINSGVKLMPGGEVKDLWYYVPFNMRFEQVISEFVKRLNAEGIDIKNLNDGQFVKGNMALLKKKYQNLGKDPHQGTAINFNSLQLLSYPAKAEICKGYGRKTICDTYFPDASRWNSSLTAYMMKRENLYPASCLYTGDTSANDKRVWDRLIDVINRYLGKTLVLYQIPHHGSRYSNDVKLMDFTKFYAAFTNYGPFFKSTIFDDRLPMMFALKHKPLILVTNEYASQFEEYWKLD